jgi:phage shock protein A
MALTVIPGPRDRGKRAGSGGGITVGMARRVAELYRAKVNALLDRAEDPREMLGYSYGQQREFLRRMRSAGADLAASRKRAEAQERDLRRAAARLRDQAAQVLAAGREDLGREVLIHRAEMIAHADDLAAEQAVLRAEEERLAEAARRLQTRFEALRYRKEAIKAAYAAAGAATAGAATAGERVRPSVDVADVVAAARRAEEQAAALRARAEALSQQVRAGGSGSPLPLDFYRIQEQLDALTRDAAVEEELARIRAEMSPRATKRPPGKDRGRV